MSWQDQLRAEVPLQQRAAFLVELQAMVSDVRVGRKPVPTPLLQQYPALTVAYMDEGEKKRQAARALGLE